MKKIILTGGGTAGHVTPNLALLPALREEDFEIHYIGSYNGIERRLIEAASIPSMESHRENCAVILTLRIFQIRFAF